MNQLIHEIKNQCLNINAISDMEYIKELFLEVNDYKLTKVEKSILNECLVYMIEQLTSNNIEWNEYKITSLEEIIDQYISNNLNVLYYYYYLAIRIDTFFDRNNIDLVLQEILDNDMSFISDLQKISFISYIKKSSVKANEELLSKVIDKLQSANILEQHNNPVSKIKQLEEQNKILQEELANVNYILMMQDMI